jgi:hypothetical protein
LGGPLYARAGAFVCPRGRVPPDAEDRPCGVALQHGSRVPRLAQLDPPVPRRLTSLSLSAARHKPAGMLRRKAARARISVDDKPRDGLARTEPITALARSTGRGDDTGCNEGRLTSSHSPQRSPVRGVPSAPCGRRPRGQPSNLRQGGKGVSCGAAHGPLGNPTRPPRRGRRVTRCPR